MMLDNRKMWNLHHDRTHVCRWTTTNSQNTNSPALREQLYPGIDIPLSTLSRTPELVTPDYVPMTFSYTVFVPPDGTKMRKCRTPMTTRSSSSICCACMFLHLPHYKDPGLLDLPSGKNQFNTFSIFFMTLWLTKKKGQDLT